MNLKVDKQAKDLIHKNNAEQDKKGAKYSLLFDKFSKLSEKCVQVEYAKKTYSEKFKEMEKENKELRKTGMDLKEKVDLVVKENAELRQTRATKEKFLIERVKRAEKGKPKLLKEEEEKNPAEKLRFKKKEEDKENENEELDWENYRLQRKIDSSSL